MTISRTVSANAALSFVAVCLVAALAACSDSTSTSTVPAGPGVWATINVNLVPAEGTVAAHTSVAAFAKDAPPLPDSSTATATVGDCKLIPTSPACSATCATDESCVAKDTCQKTPMSVTMGDLSFTGLQLAAGGTNFTLSPIGTTYATAGATDVAYPGCSAGQTVTVAGGADADTAFSLKTTCIDSLVVTSVAPIPFESGKAAHLTWTPQTTGTARVTVRIDISHHGGLKGLIVCDTADSGTLNVDASLVKGLIDLGTAGYPVIRLARLSTATAAAGSGKATLNIQSTVEVPLAVPGVRSCDDDSACDTGQACVALKCQ